MSATKPQRIHLAVLALGGQGGGVLVDWIVELAEHAGWTAQATSVAGVAQRTGATIYYIELVSPTPGRRPVLALMPVPGEVDVLIAAELMEAGRAVERGLVTPDRTTLIASSHRAYAVQEKMVPGNGVADGAAVLAHVQSQACRSVIADMQALAQQQGSVISASLFGALAGCGRLPFTQDDFEAVVQRSGVGVQPSLAALRAAARLAREAGPAPRPAAEPMQTAPRPLPQQAAAPALQALLERIRREFPPPAWPWLGEGLARVVDWQDIAYGQEYLDRVGRLSARGRSDPAHMLSIEAARWIAVAMSYDDVIRVAELKCRGERSARLRREIGGEASAVPDAIVGAEEYFHPRLEEALATLPRGLADWLDRTRWLKAWLAPRLDRGRRIQSQRLWGHLQLRLLASLRRWRRGTRRHAEVQAHLQRWLASVEQALPSNPDVAVELLRCQRLVKGYSDTQVRGHSRFNSLMQAAAQVHGRADAAATLALLREAALRDADGLTLQAQWQLLGLG
ncbi:indolepyruvate oxidoreductase subunit beta family protein [Paucibacter sediminis]|uniref:Indolepyruvate oxidoreductase subunit beta family protein n=1 Tax=Paucibacter sediminis TaxID=3019553 RepID=A0AA95NEY5_9BURK|nr:indolepyruvate oxidoreductase subunit beta family protein [Paucibacter sp. S2-9]WIT11642.1 indolepyruvate oxidoreductase subunit beta family protein [Paucibacter sp. S2-9]